MGDRFASIHQGQSKDEVIAIMGQPHAIVRPASDKEVYVWQIDPFTRCGVGFTGSAGNDYKDCKSDEVARAQARAAFFGQMAQDTRQPASNQMPIYNGGQSTQTNCRTRWNGSAYVSDCNSRQTGIDTSIYH